jgi:hypothetical protein
VATPTRAGSRGTAFDAEPAGGPTRTPYVRRIVVVICLVTVGVLFGAVVRQSWSATSQAAEVVRLEAAGAAMMHPMTTLLTELVTAQSAAVRDGDVNQTSVRSALARLPTNASATWPRRSRRRSRRVTRVGPPTSATRRWSTSHST